MILGCTNRGKFKLIPHLHSKQINLQLTKKKGCFVGTLKCLMLRSQILTTLQGLLASRVQNNEKFFILKGFEKLWYSVPLFMHRSPFPFHLGNIYVPSKAHRGISSSSGRASLSPSPSPENHTAPCVPPESMQGCQHWHLACLISLILLAGPSASTAMPLLLHYCYSYPVAGETEE